MGDYLLHCIENDGRADRMGDMFAGQLRFKHVFCGTVGYCDMTIAVQKQERIGQRIGHCRKQSEWFARARIFLSRGWLGDIVGEQPNHAGGAGEGLLSTYAFHIAGFCRNILPGAKR